MVTVLICALGGGVVLGRCSAAAAVLVVVVVVIILGASVAECDAVSMLSVASHGHGRNWSGSGLLVEPCSEFL
jgi:hypothetical protein